MIVRTATVDDLPVIRQLAYDTWPATYGSILSQEQLDYMLEQMYSLSTLTQQLESGHHFILAEHEGHAIGFAGYSAADESGIYKLHKLYVLPNIQKTGAGRALLAHVVTAATQAGATTLHLNVNRFNKAKAFYEKQGFEVIAEKDIAIGNGYYMNDYIMARTLTT